MLCSVLHTCLFHAGPSEGVPVANLPVCLQKLKLSFRDVNSVLEGLTATHVHVPSLGPVCQLLMRQVWSNLFTEIATAYIPH